MPLLTGCDRALTFFAGESNGGGLAHSNWSGSNASISRASFNTARTQTAWEDLWKTIGQPVPGKLPEGKMAVAVFLGQRFDAGARVEIYDAEIRRRVGEPEHAVVTYRELMAPLVDGKQLRVEDNAAAILSPWAVRLMDKTVLEPDFQREGS